MLVYKYLCKRGGMGKGYLFGVNLGVHLGIADEVYDPALRIVHIHVQLLSQHSEREKRSK